MIVKVILDRQGIPTRPQILEELDSPTLTFNALEALRDWRFRPALCDGEPVAVFYSLTVNYRLRK